ncbi:hypothetical protein C8R46DRAFT_1060966 [Mycena filopes]|nr:hypothetical protein C8R46DRAFT_1060966 [Mycena filopes]
MQRLTSSMPMHPLPILLNHGVPIAISSDDPSIFGNMGLSFDMYQVQAKDFIRVQQSFMPCESLLEIVFRYDLSRTEFAG